MPYGKKLERALHVVFALIAVVWVLLGLLMVFIHMTEPADAAELRPGELEIMARIVQAETTGEPAAGARAVAWTMLNRLRSDGYGKTLTRIMLAPYQYAKPAPLVDSSTDYLRALLATVQAVLGEGGDPSNGATHFLRCDLRPQPRWALEFERRAVHGNHCFYRNTR
jgi:spore germination cell wall hydrolase CwlJ-like protein